MKFVSHLDMNRFMSRIINKAKVPVWFTEGFNKHAYLNFAVPLSLGYEGLYEILDVKISDDNYPLSDVLSALQSVSVPDIEFFAVEEAQMNMKHIAFAEFEILLDEISEPNSNKIIDFFAKSSILCQKTTKKGGTKEIDIAPLIKKYSLDGNKLTLVLTAGNENNLNPSLVMQTLFEQAEIAPVYYQVTRTMIYNTQMQQFK
jgi:radical SAM-linked protein